MNNNGNTLTQKQEKFILNYFDTGDPMQSYKDAGYAVTTYGSAAAASTRLLKSVKIQDRLQQLRDKAESDKVMLVTERLERLSEIARAKLTDFQTAGADGSWIDIGPENPHAAALQEIASRTEYDKDGDKPSVITKVKLHSPIQAIDLMNKMEKIYTDGTTVNVDNRQIIFQGVDQETQKMIEELASE